MAAHPERSRLSRSAGRPGRGVLFLGLLCLGLDRCPTDLMVPAALAGEPLEVRLESLQGEGFRLLPGVGPVLAERLEHARVAAGGVLSPQMAASVRGVGPSLLARWTQMRSR